MKYTVGNSEIDIIDYNWDLCIIIDSCRYDVFKSIYKDVFKNIYKSIYLKEACSHCAGTMEFMKNHLNSDYIDIVYVNHTVSRQYWIPNTEFFEVVDVWKTHWDYDKWGTLMPWDMADVAIEKIKQHYPKKRVMLHFVQAHPPYLLPGYEEFNKREYTPERTIKHWSEGRPKRRRGLKEIYQGVLRKRIGYERTWRLLIRLGVEPSDYFGRVYKKFGWSGLVDGYRENMLLTLHEAKRVADAFPEGKILISADHSQSIIGDRRGVREESIPWLVIEK